MTKKSSPDIERHPLWYTYYNRPPHMLDSKRNFDEIDRLSDLDKRFDEIDRMGSLNDFRKRNFDEIDRLGSLTDF
jgi:hypothetical protein